MLTAQKGCPVDVLLRGLPSLSAAVDRVKRLSPESQSNNLWVIVGVVIPVLVVMVIVVILYWKLCRTDKLDFQPDAVANIQQRQKVRGESRRSYTRLAGRDRGAQALDTERELVGTSFGINGGVPWPSRVLAEFPFLLYARR